MKVRHRTTSADEAALLRAIHANPLEDTPRLMWADMVEERGDSELAEFIRLNVAGKYPGNAGSCIAKLVRPKPRGMHFVGVQRGLPTLALHYPHDNLDYFASRIPPHYCIRSVLECCRPSEYQRALCHPITAQVHCVQMYVVDEYDVLALSETACADRHIRLIAAWVRPSAYDAARELLPRAALVAIQPRRRTRRMNLALSLHLHRFDP